MNRLSQLCLLALLASFSVGICAPAYSAEQVEVVPPAPREEAPAPNATVAELDKRGDELRAGKNYRDAIDYYRAALKKDSRNALIENKIGLAQMQLQEYSAAGKAFRNAIRIDKTYADAHNNLGANFYLQKNYNKAIREYEVALKLKSDSASFYANLGAAYFAKKEPEKAMDAYVRALQLDPDVLNRSSRAGVVGQTTPEGERAYYEYLMAKAYAKNGLLDLSLQHLRKAIEEQYKDINKVYKDEEFAALRKDPRFAELMAAKPPALTD